ncbi:hypothetical protein AYI70_g8884 [Smittium culicis]|uniref:Uncharacterized protein n=1 Tax=Smittium culicis TaxID=133412 RepID=A0A1R1XDX7_9FUNG|nr:hypothetical protein AYI70_g8884 [Smittium culicis]
MAKSSLKFSLPEPAKIEFSTPTASVFEYDTPKTIINNYIIYDTTKISSDGKDLPKNESSGTNPTTINKLMGTVGLKNPPAYSINLKKLASE